MKEILKNYSSIDNFTNLKCPNCNSSNLIKWGTYYRNAIYINENKLESMIIAIQRIKCKDCNKTHGLLPSILIPYKQFSTDTIIEFLNLTNNDICKQYLIDINTVIRIKKQFSKYFKSKLIVMFPMLKINTILNKIKLNLFGFYEQYYKMYNICFMQFKKLYLGMCLL